MSLDFGSMKNELSRRLGDPITDSTSDGDRYTNDMWADWLNQAAEIVAGDVPINAEWTLYTTSTSTSTSTQTCTASLPTDLLKLVDVSRSDVANTDLRRARLIPLAMKVYAADSGSLHYATSTQPAVWVEQGNTLGFLPCAPATTQTATVQIGYIKNPADMTTSTNTSGLPDIMEEPILLYAEHLGHLATGDTQKGTLALRRYLRLLGEINKVASRKLIV